MNARTACKLAAALAASLLVVALPVRAGIRVSLEEELRLLEQGIQPRLRIAGAEFRVAVFTYEDPDETGLGNALASLVAGEILLRSRVSSIGVLRYEGSVLPEEQGGLGYFDKVERVAEAQQVTLAVWGVVRQVRERLVVDTYVQVPPGTIDEAFLWIVSLPEAMGGGDLLARLRPNRIPAQRLDLPLGAIEVLGQAARNLNELRSEPRIRLAGQITGVEGYLESAASGLATALFTSLERRGPVPEAFPATTALGALTRHLTESAAKHFQPANINYGLFTDLGERVPKRQRRQAYAERAWTDLTAWAQRHQVETEEIPCATSSPAISST